MNDTGRGNFAWQEGYGAFTVGISQQAKTTRYINSQAEHHRSRAFEDEFLAFLKKHGIESDPKYLGIDHDSAVLTGLGEDVGTLPPLKRWAIGVWASGTHLLHSPAVAYGY